MATVDELLPTIGRLETGGMDDPDAAVSRTGAVGRYQIEPSTAEQYGFDPSRLHEDAYNETAARTILGDLIKRSGGEKADNGRAVLVGYNAGPGRMAKFLANGGDVSELPGETQGYLRKSGLMPQPEAHADAMTPVPPEKANSLPDMWDSLSAARAHGFTWSQIGEAYDAKRDEGLKAGFSNGDINEAFGLPRNYLWQTSTQTAHSLADASPNQDPTQTFGQKILHGAGRLFDDAVKGYESWADANQAEVKATQADDASRMKLAMQTGHFLPTMQGPGAAWAMSQVIPGPDVEGPAMMAHELLKAFGWDMPEAVRVFGPKFVSSVHATIEHIDGQQKTVEEVQGLQKEAVPFKDFMGTARKQAEALDSPQNVIDAGTGLAADRPLKAFVDTMSEKPLDAQLAMKAIGRGIADTGETAAQVAERYKTTPALLVDAMKRVLADEEGALKTPEAAPPYPGGPVADIPQVTAATIRTPDLPWYSKSIDEINKIFTPEVRSPQAWEASRIKREGEASGFNETQRVAIRVREFGRAAASLSNAERLDFLTRWQTGDMGPFKGTMLGKLYDTFAPQIQKMGEELQRRDKLDDLVTNYLSGMWRGRVSQNGEMLKQLLGKSPFLRQKIFQTYTEGMKAGMIPRTLNPVEIVLKTMAMEKQYLAKLDSLEEMKAKGLLWDERALPGGKLPSGMAYIDERIAHPSPTPVIHPSGETAFMPARYVATQEVADLFKAAFDPSKLADSTIYSLTRHASMTYISFELSASLFHLSMMSAASIWSGLSLAGQRMSRFLMNPTKAGALEEGGRGLMSLPAAFMKPITYLYTGNKVLNQALGLKDYGWKMQQRVEALQSGGYHFGKEDWYNASPQGSFWQSLRGTAQWMAGQSGGRMGFLQDIEEMFRDQMLAQGAAGSRTPFQLANATVRVGLKMIPRSLDTAMGFLFGQKGVVQMLKAGAADDLVKDALRVNPGMDHGAMRDFASRVSDSIDNRFGMLQYDNTFWNKYFKDIGPLTTISLGWQAGTFRDLIGGTNDIRHMITRGEVERVGQFKQISARAAALTMFVPTVALYHAIYGYLKGQDISSWGPYDYFHPPTGGTNPDGSPQRAALPFYDNEVYKILADPIGGTMSEAFDNSFMKSIKDMTNNEDWMGAAIANPGDPDWKQGEDYGLYFLKQMEPIVLQNMREQPPHTGIGFWESILGVRQAPEEFNMPAEYERWVQKQIQKKLRLRDIEQGREERREEQQDDE